MENKKTIDWIMEISGANKFEIFNDSEGDCVRLLYAPDPTNEDDNVRIMFTEKNFHNFVDMISCMTLNDFEDLKELIKNICPDEN
jgi:hypothetical protein